MKTLISIIIPVYQVERYILDCLRSVVCETVSGERLADERMSGERLAGSGESLRSGDGERVTGDGEACGQFSGERLADERMSGERLAVNEERETRNDERGTLKVERLTRNEMEGDGEASLTAHRSPLTVKDRSPLTDAEGTLHPSPFTRHNTEVILVDDCGSDRSIALAEEYLQGIPGLNYRILHHTHNRGLSAARNTGLAAAQGEYVYFLDSDDEILPGALTTLLQPLKDVKYDLVVGDYVEGKTVSGERLADERMSGERGADERMNGERLAVNEERLTMNKSVPNGPLTAHRSPLTVKDRSPLTVNSPKASMLRRPTGPVMGNEEILKGYATGEWYVMAWNKLCRREFLITNGLWFEEGLLHEDVVWTFKVACLAKSMYVAKVPTYFYRTREASIMTGTSVDKDVSIYVEACNKIADFITEKKRTEGRWEYYIFQGKRAGILYSLLQKGERELYQKYYPDFYRQCYLSPWKAYRKGIISLKYLVRDLHYLLPMACGRIYKEWFYNICYRMRNKRIEGAVWD